LWRVIAGFAVLGSLLAILLSLGPVYLKNDRFKSRVRSVVEQNAGVSDDALRVLLVSEAKEFSLPVLPGDVKISHPSGKVEAQVTYKVQKSLGLYRIDLHFHPSAKAK
jgi:hypothetical protein